VEKAAKPRETSARARCAVADAFDDDRDASVSPRAEAKSPRAIAAADGAAEGAETRVVLCARVARRATLSSAHRAAMVIGGPRALRAGRVGGVARGNPKRDASGARGGRSAGAAEPAGENV
jgi:hypothetical protein